jgi:hypothetical protein
VSIPGHGLALNVTVQSYNGVLEFGLTACRRAVPDIGDLADYMVDAAHELGKLVAAAAAQVGEGAAPAATLAVASTEAPARTPRARGTMPKALVPADAKAKPARRRRETTIA